MSRPFKIVLILIYVAVSIGIGWLAAWYMYNQIKAEDFAQQTEAEYEAYHYKVMRGENPEPPEPLKGYLQDTHNPQEAGRNE